VRLCVSLAVSNCDALWVWLGVRLCVSLAVSNCDALWVWLGVRLCVSLAVSNCDALWVWLDVRLCVSLAVCTCEVLWSWLGDCDCVAVGAAVPLEVTVAVADNEPEEVADGETVSEDVDVTELVAVNDVLAVAVGDEVAKPRSSMPKRRREAAKILYVTEARSRFGMPHSR
jgi:hypothetical protein